jgi:hypothetical protein
MIAQKGQPALRRFWISGCAFHPAGDSSLRNVEAQHEKFSVNPTSTPTRVLRHHPEDQTPNFVRDPLSTNLFSHPRNQAPVHAKSSTMPAHNGLRSNQDERLLPGRPKSASEQPEEFIESSESGFRVPALQDSQLLPERQVLYE